MKGKGLTTVLAAALAAFFVSTGGVAAQENAAPGAGQLQMMDHRFVVATALGDQMEIDISRMAAQQGASDAVRTFAQRLVQDHQRSSQELQALARAKGVTLPPPMMMDMGAPATGLRAQPNGALNGSAAAQEGAPGATGMPPMTVDLQRLGLSHLPVAHRDHRMLLSSLSGPQFDEMWVGEQVKHHAKAVADFELHARNARDADVRAFAARTLPVLREHYQMARGLARLNGGGAAALGGAAAPPGGVRRGVSGQGDDDTGARVAGSRQSTRAGRRRVAH